MTWTTDRLIGQKETSRRTKFRSPAFHQVLSLKHLPGISSLLTFLQTQAALQTSTFFYELLFHTLRFQTKFGSGLWSRHCKVSHPSILTLFLEILLRLLTWGHCLQSCSQKSTKTPLLVLAPEQTQTQATTCHSILKCKLITLLYFH